MAERLLPRLARFPGAVERIQLGATPRVRDDGTVEDIGLGEALRLVVRPDAPIQIALTGHYDTVFAGDHPFQTPRWAEPNILNGPGVADMKGGILVMLAALEALEASDDAGCVGYTVLLSPDEEIGSPGSAPLLAALGARSHVGMTYEPAMADGGLAGARKGSGNYSLIITGRAAHVGRAFADGRSAIVAAAEAVALLHDLNGRRDGVTVNIGSIDGGAPVNVVPDGAVVRFNVRMNDEQECAWIQGEVTRIAARISGKDGINAHLHGGISRPPKPMTPSQRTLFGWLKEAGAAIGLDPPVRPTGGVCEGNNLLAAGCPNIDTLGVRGGALHSGDEFALADSFVERAKLSFLLLHGFATGRWDPRALRA